MPNIVNKGSNRISKRHSNYHSNQRFKKKPSTNPEFLYSSRDPSGSTSDNPAKYPSPMLIIKQDSVPSETPTKENSHVTKEFTSSKPIKMLIEYPSGYQTGATITIPNENPGSKPRAHPRSYTDALNLGSQHAQLIMQTNTILLLIHKIFFSFSRQRATWTRQ